MDMGKNHTDDNTPATAAEGAALELLSQLADGQCDADLAGRAVSHCLADGELRRTWVEWHLIGDVMREGAPAASGWQRSGTAAAVMARLASEPVPQAAVRLVTRDQPDLPQAPARPIDVTTGRSAANDAVFRWRLVAGVTSLLAVGSLAFALWGQGSRAPGAELAQGAPAPALPYAVVVAPAPAGASVAAGTPAAPAGSEIVVASAQGQVIRDARLEELLAAHRQMGAPNAWQVPSGFLRNATFDTTLTSGERR